VKKMIYSINSWIYGNTTIEEIAVRARQIGVDGLDISGEPDTINVKETKKVLENNGINAFCVNGNYTEDTRVFCHSDKSMREKAIEYGKKCVDMAAEIGAGNFLIVPSQVNATDYHISKQEDWKHSAESIREVAEHAKDQGIQIVLECVNKYEVSLVRTLQDGIDMAKQVELDNVKIIGDTFHMNLEESRGIANAIRQAGSKWLAHLHLGDNIREVPGMGCIDWREILIALDDIDYNGVLSFEPLPHRMTLDEIFAGALEPSVLSKELEFSLNYLKMIEKTIF
jgi:D-psicose/D-tagatose/L-ribulose 3-epimerase